MYICLHKLSSVQILQCGRFDSVKMLLEEKIKSTPSDQSESGIRVRVRIAMIDYCINASKLLERFSEANIIRKITFRKRSASLEKTVTKIDKTQVYTISECYPMTLNNLNKMT